MTNLCSAILSLWQLPARSWSSKLVFEAMTIFSWIMRRPALHIPVSIDTGKKSIHGDLSKGEQTLDVGRGRPCRLLGSI